MRRPGNGVRACGDSALPVLQGLGQLFDVSQDATAGTPSGSRRRVGRLSLLVLLLAVGRRGGVLGELQRPEDRASGR